MHIVGQKEPSKKEKRTAEEEARRPASKIGYYVVVGCFAFAMGYITRSCFRADIHCSESREKWFLQTLTPPEKINPNQENSAEDGYRDFVK